MANMTMIGLYDYDNTLFDNLVLPEGIDKDIAVNEILTRCGEFEVLYSNPAYNKYQIGKWGEKHYRTFEKCITALNIEYAPLENYDRQEEWTDDNTGTQTMEKTGTQTTVNSGSETNVKSGSEKDETDNGNTTEIQVAAYDTATYSNKEKTIFDTDQSNEHTYDDVTDTHTLNDLTNERTDDLEEKRTDDLSGHHLGRIHGNIGVTTSMQLLREELDVQRFNIYENIADIFIDEFCILIY